MKLKRGPGLGHKAVDTKRYIDHVSRFSTYPQQGLVDLVRQKQKFSQILLGFRWQADHEIKLEMIDPGPRQSLCRA